MTKEDSMCGRLPAMNRGCDLKSRIAWCYQLPEDLLLGRVNLNTLSRLVEFRVAAAWMDKDVLLSQHVGVGLVCKVERRQRLPAAPCDRQSTRRLLTNVRDGPLQPPMVSRQTQRSGHQQHVVVGFCAGRQLGSDSTP
jgi:hypothetical protein